MTATPRTMALRFRIWAYAQPRGWDVTFAEVADALGVSVKSVGAIAQAAGWVQRFRVADTHARRDAWGESNGHFIYARHAAADIVAGRIGYAP